MNTIRILTYNIHKGFSIGNRKYVLDNIKDSIQEVHADLVYLQEVSGHHIDRPGSQMEFLADETWSHAAYGKNAVYEEGHHGNAILSKYPIVFWENQDVSFNSIERRGLLHAEIKEGNQVIHAFCVHLGLFEKDRITQIERLSERISRMVPPDAAIIIAGDFNDWRINASDKLISLLNVKEAFLSIHGTHPKTFPSWFPILALDRIYYRNLTCKSVNVLQGKLWSQLSDHLPLLAEFEFPKDRK